LAVVTPNEVEIWDTLTLGKRSTLQPTNPSHKLWDIHRKGIPGGSPNGVAYSPDGCSLACYSSFSTTIIIWDIQTGGVINEIECGAVSTTLESLVWSFDGKTLGAVFAGGEAWVVGICDVASHMMVSLGTLQSSHKPYLWPHDKSLRVLTASGHKSIDFNVYSVEPTLPITHVFSITLPRPGDRQMKSFYITLPHLGDPQTISFSPTMGQVSIVTNENLLLGFRNPDSRVLFKGSGILSGSYWSPNGCLLVASGKDVIHVWEPCYGRYQERSIPLQSGSGDVPRGLQFSPTSSSVLISGEGFLEVVHLDSAKHDPPAKSLHQCIISPDGTYIVAPHSDGHRITITNLHSQICSWSINTGVQISGWPSLAMFCW
jgi:WD40 repeat protein